MTEQERVHNMMLDRTQHNFRLHMSEIIPNHDGVKLEIHRSDMEQFPDPPDAGRIILGPGASNMGDEGRT